jgi:predicted Ser/Thr protein kinase
LSVDRWGAVVLEANTLLAGRYRIDDVLAEGGMGVVYRAHDERLARLVAIKTVRYQDRNLVVRLRREAQLLARLTHPNVVSLYDVGEHEGRPYLVTQFVDGVPLRKLLGRMTERRIAWVAEQICHGLSAAHALGIVHRDLKPSNILVGDGTVRLLDFGIARHINDAALTRTESLLGTAAYISPEQLHGQPAGPGADIYALGLVLIECFSGRAAFAGTFAETVATRMIERPALPEELPPAWHELVSAMTDPDPAGRPDAPTVAATVRALGRPQAEAGAVPFAAMVAGAAAGEATVDPRRLVLPVTESTLPPEPDLVPIPTQPWEDDEPLRPRNRFLRPAVIVPAAVVIGFLLTIGSVMAITAGGGSTSGPIDASGIGQPTGPVSTLAMTEAPVTTAIPPEVLAAEATAPPTTQVPVTEPPRPVTTPAPAPPPPPPPSTKPTTTRAPATTRRPPTTCSRRDQFFGRCRQR